MSTDSEELRAMPEGEIPSKLSEESKPYSKLRALLGVFLLPAILILIIAGTAALLKSTGGQFDPTVGFALSSSSFLIAAIAYILITGKIRDIWDFLKLRSFKWYHIAIGLGGAIGTYVVAILLGMIAVLLSGGLDSEGGSNLGTNSTSETIGALSQSHSLILLGFLIAILAPVGEEIFFRGALLSSLVQESKSRWLKFGAVVVVSVIFGLVHFQAPTGSISDVLAVVVPGMVGITAAVLTLWFNSLYPAIFTHVFYNGIVFLLISSTQ